MALAPGSVEPGDKVMWIGDLNDLRVRRGEAHGHTSRGLIAIRTKFGNWNLSYANMGIYWAHGWDVTTEEALLAAARLAGSK